MSWDLENSAVLRLKTEANSHLARAFERVEDSRELPEGFSKRSNEAMQYLNESEEKLSRASIINREALDKGPGVVFPEDDSEISYDEMRRECDTALDVLEGAADRLEEGMTMYREIFESIDDKEALEELRKAEQKYEQAVQGLGTSVLETRNGIGTSFEDMPEYDPVLDDLEDDSY